MTERQVTGGNHFVVVLLCFCVVVSLRRCVVAYFVFVGVDLSAMVQ